jgi:glycosyltransferase involved in cell wall biosynthesis
MPVAPDVRHFDGCSIAVLMPCHNEEVSIAKVVKDFPAALPTATIFVFDNNSTDNTVATARAAGAEVFQEKRQGKGYVVQRMFTDVQADIYVLVDGDATYDASSSISEIRRVNDNVWRFQFSTYFACPWMALPTPQQSVINSRTLTLR